LLVNIAHFVSDGGVVEDRDGVVDNQVEPEGLTGRIDDVVEIVNELVNRLHESVHAVEAVRLNEVGLSGGGSTSDSKTSVLETLG